MHPIEPQTGGSTLDAIRSHQSLASRGKAMLAALLTHSSVEAGPATLSPVWLSQANALADESSPATRRIADAIVSGWPILLDPDSDLEPVPGRFGSDPWLALAALTAVVLRLTTLLAELGVYLLLQRTRQLIDEFEI